MEMINGQTAGDYEFTKDAILTGAVCGCAVVNGGITLAMNGTTHGDLIILPGAFCHANGAVLGNVENRGGTLTITGVVHGTVSGHALIKKHATVGSRRYLEDQQL